MTVTFMEFLPVFVIGGILFGLIYSAIEYYTHRDTPADMTEEQQSYDTSTRQYRDYLDNRRAQLATIQAEYEFKRALADDHLRRAIEAKEAGLDYRVDGDTVTITDAKPEKPEPQAQPAPQGGQFVPGVFCSPGGG